MTTYLSHKKVHFDYEVLKTYEAGIALLGHEVKSVRASRGKLEGAFVIIRGHEAFVVGLNINLYLSKKELAEIEFSTETQGLTAIPLRLYNAGRNIKLEIAVVKGKKLHDKRQSIQARDVKRDIERTLKNQ
jgi:SsrA-binding protein